MKNTTTKIGGMSVAIMFLMAGLAAMAPTAKAEDLVMESKPAALVFANGDNIAVMIGMEENDVFTSGLTQMISKNDWNSNWNTFDELFGDGQAYYVSNEDLNAAPSLTLVALIERLLPLFSSNIRYHLEYDIQMLPLRIDRNLDFHPFGPTGYGIDAGRFECRFGIEWVSGWVYTGITNITIGRTPCFVVPYPRYTPPERIDIVEENPIGEILERPKSYEIPRPEIESSLDDVLNPIRRYKSE